MIQRPDDPVSRQIEELESRVAALETRISSISQAFSQRRHQTRRLWLRPPIWTFEQYRPRKLSISASYPAERAPADAPSFAIVTSSYKHCAYLRATVDSVLGQHYPNLRYHVQDGISNDGSVEILQAFGSRLTWRSEPDSGQTQAINRAFSLVGDSDIMAYLNSDDMLLPGTLAYVASYFQANPDIDVVYGHRVFIDREGMEVGRAVLPRHDARTLYWADYIPQETMFWRRRVWSAVGPLDETFQYALDWDFILRAQAAGFKFVRLPRFLACFRVHDQQKTARQYDVGREEMQRLRRRYLGQEPAQRSIEAAVAPYLMRQLAVHWLYRCGMLRY